MKLNLCEWVIHIYKVKIRIYIQDSRLQRNFQDANPGIQTIQENILEDQLFECLCFAVSIDIDRSEFLVEPGTIKY